MNAAQSGCEYPIFCTQTAAALYFYQGVCLPNCPSGTYISLKNCYNCGSQCLYCSNANSCEICQNGYYPLLNFGFCCPQGQFFFANSCVANCPLGTTVTNNIGLCNFICQNLLYNIQDKKCYATCPTGTILKGYIC